MGLYSNTTQQKHYKQDNKKAVEISKKLIEDVCDDLDIEIHED